MWQTADEMREGSDKRTGSEMLSGFHQEEVTGKGVACERGGIAEVVESWKGYVVAGNRECVKILEC